MTTTTRTPAIEATTLGNALTLTFSTGALIQVAAHDLSAAIREQAMMHGLKQKLVDAAAISRNPDTGRSATVDDKYNAVKEVYYRLLAGQWNKGRGEGTTGMGGLLYRALCLHYPAKTPGAIRAFLDKKTPKEQAALRGVPAIAAIIDTLRAENVDSDETDSMLEELSDIE
jgi:hypothetical protein